MHSDRDVLDNHWIPILFSASWTKLGSPTFSLFSSDLACDCDCVEFDHRDSLWWVSLWPRGKVAAGSCNFLGGHSYCWVRRKTQLFRENEQNGNCVRSASALWDFCFLLCLLPRLPHVKHAPYSLAILVFSRLPQHASFFCTLFRMCLCARMLSLSLPGKHLHILEVSAHMSPFDFVKPC